MGQHKLGTTVRAAIKAIFQKRERRHMPSAARFRPVAAKARLSTRGQPGDTWNTKRWTSARQRMRDEALAYRAKMDRDRREKLASKVDHIENRA
jgi:hypothetical protein